MRSGTMAGTRSTPRRSRWLAAALLTVALPAIGALASCKQGEGQRCQVDSDCDDGLQCNIGEHLCRSSVSPGNLDALPPPDAPPDAPVDAPVDAPTDAIDAM